jgi:hypothetical protein
MKVAILVAAILFGVSAAATEQTVAVLKATAQELDNLVSQNRTVYREDVKPGFKPKRKAVPPVNLKKIVPVVATRLNLTKDQVLTLLKNDREKLSDVVLARTIEASSGKSWQELLAQHDRDELFRLTEERQLTTTVKNTLDELYAEISFAALDTLGDSARGGAPRPATGQDKGSTSAK